MIINTGYCTSGLNITLVTIATDLAENEIIYRGWNLLRNTHWHGSHQISIVNLGPNMPVIQRIFLKLDVCLEMVHY